MNEPFKVGDLVRASYKSGEYIGEIAEIRQTKAAVKVLAVLKHPAQGDLHHPMETEGVFFHQRKALHAQEIALMHFSTILPYRGEVPDYRTSLRDALQKEMRQLRKMEEWARRSIQELESLRSEYESERRI